MLKSIEGNFDHPDVNSLLVKHFIELRSVSPEGSAHVLDIRAVCKLDQLPIKKISDARMLNIIGNQIINYRDKKYAENEFFFDYLKKEIKEKRKMGHLTTLIS